MTLVEEEPVTTDLVVADANLFRASSPADVIVAAKAMAQPLGDLIRGQEMVTQIGRNEHTNIEGWQTAGAMLGISAHTVWSRPVKDLPEGERGWEARAEARTRTGEVVGAAEGMVTDIERNWRGSTDQAMRSMAQTRAQSKALASVLRFVMTLTGIKGTPLEEVEPDDKGKLPGWASPAPDITAVAQQLTALFKALGTPEPGKAAVEIGNQVFKDCSDTVPVCVARAISHIVDLMNGTTPETVDATAAEEPTTTTEDAA